jgi:cysteine synthase A
MIGAIKGYKVIIFMPENMSKERAKIMQAYGAEIVLTPASDNIKVALENALNMAQEKEQSIPGSFFVRQFENDGNPEAYEKSLAHEFLAQTPTQTIDALVLGFGSGGTVTGVGKVLKETYPSIKIVIAEPENAAILPFQHRVSDTIQIGHHSQQGIGDGIIPSFWHMDLIDNAILVSDEMAIATSKRLAKEEGILCGVSSGTNVWAAIRVAEKLDPSKTVITVLPDSGERYLSTALFD